MATVFEKLRTKIFGSGAGGASSHGNLSLDKDSEKPQLDEDNCVYGYQKFAIREDYQLVSNADEGFSRHLSTERAWTVKNYSEPCSCHDRDRYLHNISGLVVDHTGWSENIIEMTIPDKNLLSGIVCSHRYPLLTGLQNDLSPKELSDSKQGTAPRILGVAKALGEYEQSENVVTSSRVDLEAIVHPMYYTDSPKPFFKLHRGKWFFPLVAGAAAVVMAELGILLAFAAHLFSAPFLTLAFLVALTVTAVTLTSSEGRISRTIVSRIAKSRHEVAHELSLWKFGKLVFYASPDDYPHLKVVSNAIIDEVVANASKESQPTDKEVLLPDMSILATQLWDIMEERIKKLYPGVAVYPSERALVEAYNNRVRASHLLVTEKLQAILPKPDTSVADEAVVMK